MKIRYNNNNNCKTSITPMSLNSSSSKAQKNKIIWLIIHRDRQKLSLEHETANNLQWKNIFFYEMCL